MTRFRINRQGLFLAAMLITGLVAAANAAEPATSPEYEQARAVAEQFVGAWQAGDYAAMYEMLLPAARQGRSEDDFAAHYQRYAFPGGAITYRPLLPPDSLKNGKTAVRIRLEPVRGTPPPAGIVLDSLEIYLVFTAQELWKIEYVNIPPVTHFPG